MNVVAKHKKNPAAGNKMQLRKSPILIDQADAQSVVEGEEVTLMEWGNAYVRVSQSRAASRKIAATTPGQPWDAPCIQNV